MWLGCLMLSKHKISLTTAGWETLCLYQDRRTFTGLLHCEKRFLLFILLLVDDRISNR